MMVPTLTTGPWQQQECFLGLAGTNRIEKKTNMDKKVKVGKKQTNSTSQVVGT